MMATKAVEAAKNALAQPRPPNLAQNPFQSVRSIYDIVLYIVKEVLGVDPSIVINLSIFLAAAGTIGRYITNYLYTYVKSIYISSVRIHEDDSLYAYVMKYMTDKHLKSKRFRSVKAMMVKKTTIEDEEEAFKLLSLEQGSVRLGDKGRQGEDGKQLISYRTMMGCNPIQFQPYQMSHIFYHKRNIFLFRHGLRSTPVQRGFAMRQTGELTIECLGRSLDPIKAFLEEAQTYYLEKSISNTAVYRSSGPGWSNITSRPARDIDTVILEKSKKQMLLADINEYLHPQTRRWYANHGIPYRRGYLFSGPPGTGKTSLTAALAGVFGLDIYVLSLLDPYMSEEQLVRLFSSVPSRCIVLLEDIDAAGLKRNDELKRKKARGEKIPGEEDPGQPGVRKPPSINISLSGLLNAIDGVASSEGRILVMTTNKPKELDAALIRPGRVDMHIPFVLPGREEMREMFESMFSGLEKIIEISPLISGVAASKEEGPQNPTEESGDVDEDESSSDEEKLLKSVRLEKHNLDIKAEELKELAEKFADELPGENLSLAAVQGYLLRYKHDPRAAVAHAKAWSEETLAQQRQLEA
jgi:chaperone BCS1